MLSTPPAFILSQDQTLKFKCCLILSELLAWLIILVCLLLLKSISVRISSDQICSLNILLEFSRLSYCSVINVLCCPFYRSSLFILPHSLEFVKNFFISFHRLLFPRQLFNYIKVLILCQELFIFSFSRNSSAYCFQEFPFRFEDCGLRFSVTATLISLAYYILNVNLFFNFFYILLFPHFLSYFFLLPYYLKHFLLTLFGELL